LGKLKKLQNRKSFSAENNKTFSVLKSKVTERKDILKDYAITIDALKQYKTRPSKKAEYLLSKDGSSLMYFLKKQGYDLAVVANMNKLVSEIADFASNLSSLSRVMIRISDKNNAEMFSNYKEKTRTPDYVEAILPGVLNWKLYTYKEGTEELRKAIRMRATMTISMIAILFICIIGGVAFLIYSIRKETQLSNMKSDFVSTVSHEMRTPLTTIRMIGEMLQMGEVKGKEMHDEYYDTITSETERLTRLINNVLDFSRIDRGTKKYNIKQDDIASVIQSTVKAFATYVEPRGYRIILNAEDNIPKVNIDSDALAQAVLNLLDNAVKYSPVNKEIKVNLYKREDFVIIDVIDKGEGIKKDNLKKIFKRFYRGEDELTRETKGVGIGLSIVKHIMEAHNGSVTVESNKGEGSAFKLWFPFEKGIKCRES